MLKGLGLLNLPFLAAIEKTHLCKGEFYDSLEKNIRRV